MKKNMAKILFYRSDWTANTDRRILDEYGGVGYYRIVKVAEQAKNHTVDVVGAKFTLKGESLEDRYTRIFNKYDILWTCYTAHSEDASAMFYFRDKLKKKVVIDLDDNYLDVAESHNLYDRLKMGKKDRAFIGTALSFADAITVSSEPLKQRMEEHFKTVYGIEKKIFVLPNMNDVKDWDYPVVAKSDKKFIVGYAGSNSHNEDLKMFVPHLAKIMNENENVYFESTGAIERKKLDYLGFPEFMTESSLTRCDLIPSTSIFKEYPKHIANQPWDVAVAPLADNAFNRCKSHIKWIECSMFKIPVIASRVYPYYVDLWGRKTVEHDKTGLLVKPSEWVDALKELMDNKEKRTSLGENAYNSIKENWQYNDDFVVAIDKVISSL